jgi:hypothetical protein
MTKGQEKDTSDSRNSCWKGKSKGARVVGHIAARTVEIWGSCHTSRDALNMYFQNTSSLSDGMINNSIAAGERKTRIRCGSFTSFTVDVPT